MKKTQIRSHNCSHVRDRLVRERRASANTALARAEGQRLVRATAVAGREQLRSRSAINQLEMWQEATFNPEEIDKELTWAESLGMNTMRVFLHDLLWQQDAAGFQKRIDQFLTIASRHHIRPMFVLFDSCWDPQPHLDCSTHQSRSPQLRLGTKSRRDGAGRRKSISAAESLRARRSRSLREGRPHPCLGHLERAQCR